MTEDLKQSRPVEPPPFPTEARKLGFWLTTAFTVLILVVQVLAGVLAMIPILIWKRPSLSELDEVTARGDFFALAATLGSLAWMASLAVIWFYPGLSVKEHFGLGRIRWKATVFWSLVFVAFMLGSDMLRELGDVPVVPRQTLQVWQSVSPWMMPVLIFAIVVLAPLGEEFMFRGFVFEGYRRSSAGVIVAVLLSSLLWAGLHLQYRWYDIVALFFMGCLLCVVRLRCGSVWVCVFLHALNNMVACIQTTMHVQGSAP